MTHRATHENLHDPFFSLGVRHGVGAAPQYLITIMPILFKYLENS